MSDAQPPPPPEQQPHPPAAPPPQVNPYGGPTTAPAGTGARLAWVESQFGPVASFGDRALALLIDMAYSLVFFVPMVVGIVLTVAGVPRETTYDADGVAHLVGGNGGLLAAGIAVIVLASLAAAVFNLWNRVWRMGRTGQSLGKRHTGLRLIDERTGQPVGAGTCLGRELLSGLVNQVVWLSYLWMLWDDNRQTLADKAVGSTVVKLPRG
ncbi:RDD family protein [Phycicoccus endophyticus]|uniref:RDD family protein n=1 Tax=Phycicoccus endophyticus TaxID=1690220 RepID=UPI0014076468|nr:RDD family protein [Phycicoccus endophyticus]NHI19770.1 RDD family protein [Phycicoccus endophyticus]GGL33196.1 hypothetical protein GCM10012283_14580 [Phycicoccus endophyticus]